MSTEAYPIYPESVYIVRTAEIVDLRNKSPAELRRQETRQNRSHIADAISTLDIDPDSKQPLCVAPNLRQHFFGPDEETKLERNKREQVAIAICMMCPIRESCLDTSIEEQYPFGVWGGLGEWERSKILKKSNAPVKSHSFDACNR